MRLLTLAAGIATGYVLGTRAGRGKYEQIVEGARQLRANPTLAQAQATAKHLATTPTAAHGSAGSNGSFGSTGSTGSAGLTGSSGLAGSAGSTTPVVATTTGTGSATGAPSALNKPAAAAPKAPRRTTGTGSGQDNGQATPATFADPLR